jgi:hypothetical protein
MPWSHVTPLIGALLVLVIASPASATPLGYLTSVDLGSRGHDMKIAGSLAYVATDAGLVILDLAHPAAPTVRGALATGGTSRSQGIDVQGGYAYLASQYDGVLVVDVSQPTAPTIVGRRKLPGAVWDVAVKGNHAYAVTFQGELYVLDVSVKTAPVLVKTLGLLTWSSAKLDASMIKKLAAHPKSGSAKATSVAIEGNLLLTNDWNYGRLYAYDISTPASPQFRGTHHVPFVLGVAADATRNVIYMLSAYAKTSGIYTLPISLLSPTVPTRHATCTRCTFLESGYNIDQGGLALSPGRGRLFYGGGFSGEFHIVNAQGAPALFDEHFVHIGAHGLGLAETQGFAAAGDYVYVSAGALGVQVYSYPGAAQ